MDEAALKLADGLAALDLACPPARQARLLDFLRLMQKWNRVYNLTAIRDLREAVDLHLLDSLTLQPHLHGKRILDIGTGAGLPGLPLAILNDERVFTLLDCNSKKTRFVQQAVIELGLRNVTVVAARVEQYRPPQGFDTILTRAFAKLADIVAVARGLLAPEGVLLAQKGLWPQEEIAETQDASPGIALRTHRLAIPGLNVERHLIECSPSRK